MNSGTHTLSLAGEAGVIEALLDVPDAEASSVGSLRGTEETGSRLLIFTGRGVPSATDLGSSSGSSLS